jgi:hypothetical protein
MNIKLRYWCFTDGCEAKKMKDGVLIIKDETQENELTLCPYCGAELKLAGRVISGGFLKFASMAPNEKAKVLKERSHQHFLKEIKPQKDEMDKI